MEQTSFTVLRGRHSGWSEEENKLLWETADEAQMKGLPLKQVFDRIAEQTGRRPNSIRNYYYAQVRQREGEQAHTPRFVPFAEDEVEALVEQVLRARAEGHSVRSCLQEMSGGNHSLMLRYQNKYRSVLKNRPELIQKIMERLREEGVDCPQPEVRPRLHATLDQAAMLLEGAAKSVSDAELIRACEVFARMILSVRSEDRGAVQLDRMNVRMDLYRLALSERIREIEQMRLAADDLTVSLKEFLILPEDEKHRSLAAFCEEVKEKIGALEGCVTAAAPQETEN
jgi:hypothetical protein